MSVVDNIINLMTKKERVGGTSFLVIRFMIW